jgi:hypothetical protein
MPTIRLHLTTISTPEQYIAGLTDIWERLTTTGPIPIESS